RIVGKAAMGAQLRERRVGSLLERASHRGECVRLPDANRPGWQRAEEQDGASRAEHEAAPGDTGEEPARNRPEGVLVHSGACEEEGASTLADRPATKVSARFGSQGRRPCSATR